jgi:hypothetical protein
MTSTEDHYWTDDRSIFAEDPVYDVQELPLDAVGAAAAVASMAVEPETKAEMHGRMFAALNRLEGGVDGSVPLRMPSADDGLVPTVSSDRVVDAVIFDVRCRWDVAIAVCLYALITV